MRRLRLGQLDWPAPSQSPPGELASEVPVCDSESEIAER